MTKEKTYITNIVLASGLIIISLLFKIQWLVYVAIAVLVLTALSKTIAEWIALAWMGFGKVLGKINSTIILSIFFLCILFPTSVLKKILSKTKKKETSKWIDINSEQINFFKPW